MFTDKNKYNILIGEYSIFCMHLSRYFFAIKFLLPFDVIFCSEIHTSIYLKTNLVKSLAVKEKYIVACMDLWKRWFGK